MAPPTSSRRLALPTIQHNTLGGTDVHEPKGIADAIEGEVYTSDGAGGGEWKQPRTAPGTTYYKAKTSSTVAPPGNSFIVWNNSTQASSTVLYISDVNESGIDVSAYFIDHLVEGSTITLQGSTSDQYQEWSVTSVIDQAGYFEVTVVSTSTGGANFSNNQTIFFSLKDGASAVSSTSVKTIQVMGWEDWNHGGSSQALASGVPEFLDNDGAGAQTNTSYKLNGSTNIWNTSTNKFDWAGGGCRVGDTVDIRVDITYTASTNNDGFALDLDMAIGGTTPFTLPIDDRNIDLAGTENVVRFVSMYIGSADVLNNPAQFKVTADTAGDSVQVNGWYVRVTPRNPRFI